MNERASRLPWDSPEEYGQRFDELNKRLGRSFALVEYPGGDQKAILQYRLAKLAMASEDIRRAIGVFEEHPDRDAWVADAIVELRNACTEVQESYAQVDPLLVDLLNYFSA